MSKTKQKILTTALLLFNKNGLPKVTLRTIAKEMGISQGNLNYHYKKREDIIEALYFQLVENIDQSFKANTNQTNIFQTLFHISETIIENFFDYRFIFLDFVQIMRENNTIQSHYKALKIQREQQFMQLFDILISENYLRKPILKKEYENLYKRTQIITDFWISSIIIDTHSLDRAYIKEYLELMLQNIYPYLTEKGRNEYELMQKAQLNY